jgi:hypothetical protein
MRVLVFTLTGTLYTITADLDATVAAVKAKVHEAGGPLPERQCLIYNGSECSDEVSLRAVNFQNSSCFHMVEKPDRATQEAAKAERATRERDQAHAEEVEGVVSQAPQLERAHQEQQRGWCRLFSLLVGLSVGLVLARIGRMRK